MFAKKRKKYTHLYLLFAGVVVKENCYNKIPNRAKRKTFICYIGMTTPFKKKNYKATAPVSANRGGSLDPKMLEIILKQMGAVAEYPFAENGRRWRFDFAFPDERIAIEYEGMAVGEGGKSRHTTIGGYSGDCEKYNHAAINGWVVLRYTKLHTIGMVLDNINAVRQNKKIKK